MDEPIEDKMDKIIIGIPLTSLIFFTVTSLLGILLAITFLIFNLVYMKERYIWRLIFFSKIAQNLEESYIFKTWQNLKF